MINNESKMAALEMADEVLEAVKEAGSAGLRFVEGAALFDVEYNQFYQVALALAELKVIKIGRGIDGHKNRLILPDATEPAKKDLTDRQREVLEYLCSIADEDGVVTASYGQIRKNTSASCAYFALDRLDRKGFLNFIRLGGPTQSASFKIYPNGDGGTHDSWWALKHDREPFHVVLEHYRKEKSHA